MLQPIATAPSSKESDPSYYLYCNVDDGLVGKLRVNVRKFKLLLSLIERRTSVVFVFVCKSSSEYYTDSLRMMIRMQKEFVIY